ncbi:hypothetical protein [Chryseobacterium sp. R2A-55]|uniref:hypothetical protein n=1 Tax=Chryseobacterium sp. R2A-55 TaxID=2744445 RepID=UPI001F3B9340|nr:hypothetical protein [Chryseobacterium sp. R2A-55]
MNKVQQGQNFIDIVCQQTGSYEEVLAMAILNNRSITQNVNIGDEIKSTVIRNQNAVTVFAKKQPATALDQNENEPIENLEGISIWIINKTFIVQ